MPSDIIRKVDILTSSGRKFLELYLVMQPNETISTGNKRLAGLRLPTQRDDAEKTALLLVCAPSDSEVIFMQAVPHTDYWIAQTSNGPPIHINPGFTLNVELPCPLMWRTALQDTISNQLEPIHLWLEFDQDSPSQNDIKLGWQTLYSINGVDQPADAAHVLNLPYGNGTVQDFLSNYRFDTAVWSKLLPPHLLMPEAKFCSVPPLGAHYRTITFNSDVPNNEEHHPLRHYTLSVQYHADDWGSVDAVLPRIVPFDLAIKGKNGDFSNWTDDIRILQKCELVDADGTVASQLSVTWALELVWQVTDPITFPSSLVSPLTIWNRYIAQPYFDSLSAVKNGSPISILPIFNTEPSSDYVELLKNQRWDFRYLLTDTSPLTLTTAPDRFTYAFQSMNPFLDSHFLVSANLNGFRDHHGNGIERVLEVGAQPVDDDVSTSAAIPNPSDASVYLTWRDIAGSVTDLAVLDDPKLQPCRAGALDLMFKHPDRNQLQPLPPQQQPEGFVSVIISVGGALYMVRSLAAKLVMRIVGAAPGGQDATPQDYRLPADERPVSVVTPYREIDQTGVAMPIPGPIDVIVSETCDYERTQGITMSLQQADGPSVPGTTTLDTLVLSFDPFLVARVKSDPVFSTTIGAFSGVIESDASWQLQDEADGMQLILPPQVIGEEFIRDYPPAPTPAAPAEAFPFCFSPNAKFTISRSFFKQNYTEAPWNLQKILGWSSEREAGADIYNLQYELLYGLQTRIEVTGLRLQEFESSIGMLPILPVKPLGLQPSTGQKAEQVFSGLVNDKIQNNDKQIKTQLKSLRSRPAVMRAARGDEPVLELTAGMRFRIREGRRSRPNFSPPSVQGALAGGVDFGMEAPAIYRELLSSPESTTGKIVNPSFSALGGNGFQKASFLDGKLAIYSNTSYGRTFFYSVEMLGRISVLWNRAKHVVIYERSVVDTDRFVDGDHSLDGRAAVRKVDEYVEILELEKDFGGTQLNGFVEGVKFPHPIIKVDSRWATSMDNADPTLATWIVPLHSLSAPTNLYPRPDILLKLSGSESGQVTWATISNPEQLYFFTTGDPKPVENWPAFPGIDFPLLDNTQTVDSPVQRPTNGSAAPVREGLRNFTFQIDCNGGKTNLLKARSTQAVEALVENVTLSRVSLSSANASAIAPPDPKHSILVAVQTAIYSACHDLQNQAVPVKNAIDLSSFQPAKFSAAIVAAKQTLIDGFANVSTTLSTAITAGALDSTLNQLVGRQKKRVDEWTKNLQILQQQSYNALEQIWSQTNIGDQVRLSAVNSLVDQLQAQYVTNVASETGHLAQAIDSVIAQAQRAENNTKAIIANLENELGQLSGQLQADRKLFNSFVVHCTNEIMDILMQLRSTCGLTFPGLLSEQITVAAATGASQAVVLETKLIDSLNTFASSVLATPQDTVNLKAQLDAFSQAMTDAKVSIEDKLTRVGGLHEVYTTSRTALDSAFVQNITSKVTNFCECASWEQAKIQIEAAANSSNGILDTAVTAFQTATVLTNFQEEVNSILGQISQAPAGALDPLTQIVKAEATKVSSVLDTVAAGITQAQSLILNETEELQRLTDRCLGSANNLVGSYVAPVVNKVREIESEAATIVDQGMRLIRAHGLPPVAKALGIDLDKLEYVFKDTDLPVLFTQATVSFNKAEQAIKNAAELIEPTNLKALGIDLPSTSLLGDFLPIKPPKLDLKTILPDFAGLKLSDLLSNALSVDVNQLDNVKVTHGFDPTTKLPWAKTNVDVRVDDEFKVFDFDPVALAVPVSRFQAECSVSIDKQGTPRTNMHGSISGTWQLQISQKPLLTFKDTALYLDNSGNLNFDLRPQNVIIEPPLNFISELVNKLNYQDDNGLSVEVLHASGSDLPIGARAALNLALPDIAFGAFSMSHLSLSAFFELSFTPGKGTFVISAGFGFASREKPFTMTIMCLGGGGWFNITSSYSLIGPTRGLSTDLSIGLALTANLAFDIGVARGGVFFYFKVGVEWHTSNGGGGGVQISLEIDIIGEVQILSIISVSISIGLIGTYDGGTGSLQCDGWLRVRIKICWCFTIKVSKTVSITLKGKKPAPAAAPPTTPPAVAMAAPAFAGAAVPGATAVGLAAIAPPLVANRLLQIQITSQKITDSINTYVNCFGD